MTGRFFGALHNSEVLVADEAIAFGVTLENALDEAPRRVVLLVRALIELVGALAAATCSCRSAGSVTSAGRSLARAGPTAEDASLLGLYLTANLIDLHLVLAEVDTVERHQGWHPDLERGAELLILLGLAGEHRVHRILDQVQVLDLRVIRADDCESLIDITHSIVRKGQVLEVRARRERPQVDKVVVVDDERTKVAESVEGRQRAADKEES